VPTIESEKVEIEAQLKDESERWYLLYDGKRTVRVPKSIVKMSDDETVFTMPEWLALEKGLI
jgi:hypothetical protein